MVVHRGLEAYRPGRRKAAVAVGNFDGLHLGHRRIIDCLCRAAEAGRLRALVLTFYPHPERALGQKAVRMIDGLDQRLQRFREAGVGAVIVTPFDRTFARLGGRDFVEGVLRDRLRARAVVVGSDFRFGRDRLGDIASLRALARPNGIQVREVPPRVVDGRVVSSSAVRLELGRGRVEAAARLLGRPYEISGRTVRGRGRGGRIGIPTANLETENEILPDGVFISETVRRGLVRPSVTSIGVNPTFGPGPTTVETHVLGGWRAPAGAAVAVRLLKKIRPTRKFRNAEALVARIQIDLEEARSFFGLQG